ncbi:lipoprotein-releasing ABC transporter permease subunit [Colwellia sp. UCD-KL20]|uniref:lipoprotein-releasing ABC transporter permease subunit n=1 Tax=Colwellia sp. UCD-KL20 TaxID=1917165 RepID=UPI0009704286|nr:lipoprotein-releasing ABC transporter permease subunit [Colwellia sp. UCD-KL20]
MFLPASFFIGLRYSKSQRHSGFVSFITFFSIAGIVLGVASLITVVSVMNGFEGELKKRILGIVPHVVVNVKPSTDPVTAGSKVFNNWHETREKLLSLPHVTYITPFLQSEALIQSNKALQGVLLVGVFPELEQHNIINTHMVLGDLVSLNETPYSVVIGKALAYKLNVTLGDTIRIVLPNKTVFTPMGRIPVQRTFTITGVFNVGSEVDGSVVYMHSKYGAKLLKQKGDGISHLRLYLDDAFNAETLTEQVQSEFTELEFITWKNSQGALFSAVKMEKNMMWLMLSLIIAVAAFNIVSALVMVVIDKQGEIGILQTLGMNRKNILHIFIVQGVSNGVWGVLIGTILGILITLNLNIILSTIGLSILGPAFSGQNLPVNLNISNVAVIIFSALFTSFLATLYPAYRASKTLPAEVLRNE